MEKLNEKSRFCWKYTETEYVLDTHNQQGQKNSMKNLGYETNGSPKGHQPSPTIGQKPKKHDVFLRIRKNQQTYEK